MIQVEQTEFGARRGNCFAACIASILEVSLLDVPDLASMQRDGEWFHALTAWLIDKFQMYPVWLEPGNEWWPQGLAIMSADSPRVKERHAVVTENGKVVWDPHPMRSMGVGQTRGWLIFVPLDPRMQRAEIREQKGEGS